MNNSLMRATMLAQRLLYRFPGCDRHATAKVAPWRAVLMQPTPRAIEVVLAKLDVLESLSLARVVRPPRCRPGERTTKLLTMEMYTHRHRHRHRHT
mgnify:CR=1 FL=1